MILIIKNIILWLSILFRMKFRMLYFARFNGMDLVNLFFIFPEFGLLLIFGMAATWRFGLYG